MATFVFLVVRRGVVAADWNAFFALSPVAARDPSADPIVSATVTNAVSAFDSLMDIFSPKDLCDLAIRLATKDLMKQNLRTEPQPTHQIYDKNDE